MTKAQTPLENPSAFKDDQREQKIRAAQDSALVRYNGLLVLVGFLQLITFVAQAYFLRRTIKDGEKTLGVAMRGADAALVSAEAARLTASTQITLDRAWMTYKSINITAFAPDGIVKDYSISIKWANVGHTPAFQCRITGEHILVCSNDQVIPDFKERLDDGIPRHAPLMPGLILGGPPREFGRQDAEDVIYGRKRLYVWGRATYEDAFGQTRRTEICFEGNLGFKGGPHDPRVGIESVFTAIGPQNMAD